MKAIEIPGWRLAAHVAIDAPPPGWRDALAARLGARPRRIGPWAELALYGAWRCLDAAGENALPADARLRIASLSGPLAATRACLNQLHGELLPMPFDFMQSQPALMLAALARGLSWQGDASFTTGRDTPMLVRMALQGAGRGGLLWGRVEGEAGACASEWARWVPE